MRMSTSTATRHVPAGRRSVLPAAVAAVAACAAAYMSMGAVIGITVRSGARATTLPTRAAHSTTALAPAIPPTVRITPRTLRPPASSWAAVAQLGGQPAAWAARRAGVTFLRFDQRLVHVSLHAGSSDGGAVGWTYGNRITAGEAVRLLAAVNGGFKLTYANVGFMSGGRVAVPLKAGLASIVTYSDGTTNIGAWGAGVPSTRKAVLSVLQNQQLLVDRGVAAATVSACVLECWGGTVGLLTVVARSGLGITANGQLVWAAGEHLSPSSLAIALIGAGAVRAIELDINPWWVAGSSPGRSIAGAAGGRSTWGYRRLSQALQPRLSCICCELKQACTRGPARATGDCSQRGCTT